MKMKSLKQILNTYIAAKENVKRQKYKCMEMNSG